MTSMESGAPGKRSNPPYKEADIDKGEGEPSKVELDDETAAGANAPNVLDSDPTSGEMAAEAAEERFDEGAVRAAKKELEDISDQGARAMKETGTDLGAGVQTRAQTKK